MIKSIFLGIITNYLYDALNSAGCKIMNIGKRQEEDIEIVIEKKLEKYNDSSLDCSAFYNYLQEAQVKDLITGFLAYNIYGKFVDNVIDKKIIQKEEKVIEYLIDNAMLRKDIRNHDVSKMQLRGFFRDLIDACVSSIKNNLGDESKAVLFFVNSRLENIENKLESVMKNDIILQNKNYTETCLEYVNLLKRNSNMGFIYGIGEFSMYDFYVFPSFERDGFRYDMKEINLLNDVNKSRERLRRYYHSFFIENSYDIKWERIFENEDIIYVIGGPGFGKSLFLKNLINMYENINTFTNSDCLPIYCDLKLFSEFSNGKGYSITEFLIDCMVKTTLVDKEKATRELLKYYLDRGRCLILFDALDEVDRNERENLHSLIINYFLENNNNNKICITCRDRGFLPKQDIEVYKIKTMNLSMIEEYLENIIKLGYFNQSDKKEFLQQANVLIKNGFLNNFLVLSLLVSIFKAEKQLPENKIELYEKCINYIAKNREIDKGKTKYDFKLITSLINDNTFIKIALLAFPNNKNIAESRIKEVLLDSYKDMYIDENTAQNAINEFLRFCSERTELLVNSNEEQKYKFFHRTFFEYFYAKYIVKEFQEPCDITKCLLNFDLDSEIFELYIALLKKNDYDLYKKYIQYLIKKCNFIQEDISGEFFILSSMIQIVEEEKYLYDYFRIFIDRPQIMECIANLNYRNVSIVLYKIFDLSNQNKIEFYEIYKDYFLVRYLVQQKIRKEREKGEDDVNSAELNYYFFRGVCKSNKEMLAHVLMEKFEENIKEYIKVIELKDLKEIFDSVKLQTGNRRWLKQFFKEVKRELILEEDKHLEERITNDGKE